MGLFNKISGWTLGAKRQQPERRGDSIFRSCQFEELEPRRVCRLIPVIAGLTYFEGDLGQDTTPDYFEVTFQGGAATTQLTQFTINGDQDGNGNLSDGDIFLTRHRTSQARWTRRFQINMTHSSGIAADDVQSVYVSPDGLLMSVNVKNFEAGDVLAFTADVDEVERFQDGQDRLGPLSSKVPIGCDLFRFPTCFRWKINFDRACTGGGLFAAAVRRFFLR